MSPAASPAPVRRLPQQQRLAIWFYLVVPVLIGFLLGWVRAGRTAGLPLDVALIYWINVSVLSTAILGIVTAIVAAPLRRIRTPLLITLLAGQLIGGVLVVEPAMRLLRAVIRALVYPTFPTEAPWQLSHTLMTLPSNTLLWIGLNLLFFQIFRMTRFGYAPPTPGLPAMPPSKSPPTIADPNIADPDVAVADVKPPGIAAPTSEPAFMSRVKPERRGPLLALQADGHYLKVFTEAGSELILYRLADAIDEIDPTEGERVHRSWWVADRALTSERHREKLKLGIGLEIPVSRSYRVAARRRGWIVGGN